MTACSFRPKRSDRAIIGSVRMNSETVRLSTNAVPICSRKSPNDTSAINEVVIAAMITTAIGVDLQQEADDDDRDADQDEPVRSHQLPLLVGMAFMLRSSRVVEQYASRAVHSTAAHHPRAGDPPLLLARAY